MKQTLRISIILIIGGMVALTTQRCEDSMSNLYEDWLEELQVEGTRSTNELFASVSEMDPMMNGAYAVGMGFNGNGLAGSCFLIAELPGDFIAPFPPNYSLLDGTWIDLYRRRHNVINWGDHTRVLQYCSNSENLCNAIIERLESGEYDDDPDFAVMGQRLLGEAYCMRAMVNFEYTRFFGPQYHPSTLQEKAWIYRKTYITSPEKARKSRETVESSYQLLIGDCKKAIELLPLEYDPAIHKANYGINRFNKDVARALLATIYFQMNDFQNCKAVIDELLGPTPGNPENYPLEQYTGEPGTGFPTRVYWIQETRPHGRSQNEEIIFSFSFQSGPHPTTKDKNTRWKKFVSQNTTKSDLLISPADNGRWTLSDYFRNYVDFDTINDVRYLELIDRVDEPADNNKQYWWPMKYSKDGMNVLWYRSAEFLLMRAECYARPVSQGGFGDETSALADLNAIRNRAGIGDYTGSSDDNGNILQAIIQERAREIYLEKYRIWEQLRLGSIDGTKIGQGDRLLKPEGIAPRDAQFTGTDDLNWNDKWWIFPIPTRESLYNPDILD